MKFPSKFISNKGQVRENMSVRSAPEGLSRKAQAEQNHKDASQFRLTMCVSTTLGLFYPPAPPG